MRKKGDSYPRVSASNTDTISVTDANCIGCRHSLHLCEPPSEWGLPHRQGDEGDPAPEYNGEDAPPDQPAPAGQRGVGSAPGVIGHNAAAPPAIARRACGSPPLR